MQILDILGEMGGIQSVARELGISESQAASGAAALTPAILGGFKNQVQAHPSGLEGLAGILGGLGGGGLLDDVLSPQPTNVSRGQDVLGQIFGSADTSRTVAQHAATQTGLDPALLRKMLPMLAMLVAGYLAKQHSATAAPQAGGGTVSGGLSDVLGGMLGGGQGSAGGGTVSGGLGDVLGGMLGGGQRSAGGGAPGLAGILDLNGDGNPLDDILAIAGKLMR